MRSDSTWLWDQHTCLPLILDADIDVLRSYVRPQVGGFVSVNAGYAPHSMADVLAQLDFFRSAVDSHPLLQLADTVEAIEYAVNEGRVAVAFDLEDSAPLEGDLNAVHRFAALGVRTMLPTYNHANAAGCGCLDTVDTGLTAWGRALVAEMNAAGMVVDGSHCSEKTGLDLCEVSQSPVVYSHSCLRSVWDHPRNISDEQARACAATGGVIGITGVGIFLGPNTATLDAMIQHIESAVDLVGIDHVGVSTDYCFYDPADDLTANPGLYDESYTRWGPFQTVRPELLGTLGSALAERGWEDRAIGAVMSGNFARIARQVWPSIQSRETADITAAHRPESS
jgi:membrane dipeptidase